MKDELPDAQPVPRIVDPHPRSAEPVQQSCVPAVVVFQLRAPRLHRNRRNRASDAVTCLRARAAVAATVIALLARRVVSAVEGVRRAQTVRVQSSGRSPTDCRPALACAPEITIVPTRRLHLGSANNSAAVAPVPKSLRHSSSSLDDRAVLHGPISRLHEAVTWRHRPKRRDRHSRSRRETDRVRAAIALVQATIFDRPAKDRSCRTGINSKIYAQQMLGKSSEPCSCPGNVRLLHIPSTPLFTAGHGAFACPSRSRLPVGWRIAPTAWNVSEENGVATQIVLRAVPPR